MKNYINKIIVCFIALLTACTDLNVPVESELTPDNFPKTEEDYQE